MLQVRFPGKPTWSTSLPARSLLERGLENCLWERTEGEAGLQCSHSKGLSRSHGSSGAGWALQICSKLGQRDWAPQEGPAHGSSLQLSAMAGREDLAQRAWWLVLADGRLSASALKWAGLEGATASNS